jgi:hypothetical protein
MVMAKDIVYALATFDKTSNNRQVVQILGVDRKTIKRAIEKRHTLEQRKCILVTKKDKKTC